MTSIRALVGAGAVLVVSSMTATAADLYGGRGSIKDDYVAPPVQTNSCGAWYARVDSGNSSMDRPNITQAGVDDLLRPNIKDSYTLGGGIGRYFTCNVRGDITYDHRFQSGITGFNGNQFSPAYGDQKFKMSNDVVLFNAYYDFDTRSRFTPYIGVGLGFTNNHIGRGSGTVGSLASTGGFGNALTSNGNDTFHAAAAVMAGMSVALRERLSLDAGYRFLYLGTANTGNVYDTRLNAPAGRNSIEELHAHEFRVGLRYELGGGSNCCATPSYAPLK